MSAQGRSFTLLLPLLPRAPPLEKLKIPLIFCLRFVYLTSGREASDALRTGPGGVASGKQITWDRFS